MIRVTIDADFLLTTLTGDFETVQAAREFYAQELGTDPDDILIVYIEEIGGQTR